jgi:hypothetical protein
LPVTPKIITKETEREYQVVNLRASDYPKFYLTLDPNRYAYFHQVDMVLPVEGMIKLTPGIGGVDAKGNPALALVQAQAQGRKVVKPDEATYLVSYQMKPQDTIHPEGVTGYMRIWDKVVQHGKLVEVSIDWTVKLGFILDCYDKGLIEPPNSIVLKNLHAKHRQTLALLRNRTDKNAVAWDLNQKALECIQKMLSGLNGGE